MIERLCIFGVGLIGGSLAKALRARGYCKEIIGCSRNEAHLQRAVELGVIDRYSLNPADAVVGADMVFLAVPLSAMEPICRAIRGHLNPHVVVTDGGSAKGSVVAAVRRVFGHVPDFFVPGHPIAGREQSGVEAALEDLYVAQRVILTPLEDTAPQALERVKTMWLKAGAQIECMPVEKHDQLLAATSHLPHVLAYSLVDTLAGMEEGEDIFRYAAGGFRDFTRIASSDPLMWRDICLSNQAAILDMIQRYQENLALLAQYVESEDSETLLAVFQRAKAARDVFCGLSQNYNQE